MKDFYQFIVARLNGEEIETNYKYYRSLVQKGIAGFIIFGGELNTVREGIKKLQYEAERQLIISADLEQGLGQQIYGGTIFPPAMAVASAVKKRSAFSVQYLKLKLLNDTFKAMAVEARYAGINTIFAPVLDVNTNPRNPIISVRSYGEDDITVSFFGSKMVEILQKKGVAACGKHFPGHGDTEIDSHISLPTVTRDLKNLEKTELRTFSKAIDSGVKMIMLGHLRVPAIDPSGTPVSISQRAVKFLRDKMEYKGVIITDALNMGGLGKFSEKEAALKALSAGVDILLHPTDPDNIASYLKRKNIGVNPDRLDGFRSSLFSVQSEDCPDFDKHGRIARELTEGAVEISGDFMIKGKPFLVVLIDMEDDRKARFFVRQMDKRFPGLRSVCLSRGSEVKEIASPKEIYMILAVFSETRAWKGGVSKWLQGKLLSLKDRVDLIISFGSPYVLYNIENITKIVTYWGSERALKTTAKILGMKRSSSET
jgi:beta-glucosidase-like glycosyl hydrolase